MHVESEVVTCNVLKNSKQSELIPVLPITNSTINGQKNATSNMLLFVTPIHPRTSIFFNLGLFLAKSVRHSSSKANTVLSELYIPKYSNVLTDKNNLPKVVLVNLVHPDKFNTFNLGTLVDVSKKLNLSMSSTDQ